MRAPPGRGKRTRDDERGTYWQVHFPQRHHSRPGLLDSGRPIAPLITSRIGRELRVPTARAFTQAPERRQRLWKLSRDSGSTLDSSVRRAEER